MDGENNLDWAWEQERNFQGNGKFRERIRTVRMRHSECLWHIITKGKQVNLACKWRPEERRGREKNGTNTDGIEANGKTVESHCFQTLERGITHKRKSLTQSPYLLWQLNLDPSRRMEEDGKVAPHIQLLRCRWIVRAQEGSLSRLRKTSATLRPYPDTEKATEISPDRKPGGGDSGRSVAANTESFA